MWIGGQASYGGVVHWIATIAIPLVAASQHINYESGLDWEWHYLYFLILMLWKASEYLPYLRGRGPGLGIYPVVSSFVFSILAALDFYTDLVFVLIAFQSGWEKAWISLILYIVGVIGLQLLVPYCMWRTPCPPHPANPLATQVLFCSGLMGEMTIHVGSKIVPVKYYNANGTLCYALIRLIFEDLPQCYMQHLFTQVKESSVVYFSMAISIFFSIKAVWVACDTAAKANASSGYALMK